MAAGDKTDRPTLSIVIAIKLIGYLLTPNEQNNRLPALIDFDSCLNLCHSY